MTTAILQKIALRNINDTNLGSEVFTRRAADISARLKRAAALRKLSELPTPNIWAKPTLMTWKSKWPLQGRQEQIYLERQEKIHIS